MGGICADTSARAREIQPGQALQQSVEDHLLVAVLNQACPETGEDGEAEALVLQFQPVKSARSAVPAFGPGRFSGPLPAPAVRLSAQRALHKSR